MTLIGLGSVGLEMERLDAYSESRSRIVWKQPQVADTLIQPTNATVSHPKHSQEWLPGEALTNIYV